MGRFAGLVAELEQCAEVGRRAYEHAAGADREVTAAEFAELMAALAKLDRSAVAASTAALAQFARREEVPDPDNPDALVERVHAIGHVEEFAGTDVALTLGVSVRSGDTRVSRSAQLAERLPALLARVAEGEVELGQVQRVLYELGEVESVEDCHAVDEFVARRVGSCDPTRLAQLARYAISRVCPAALREAAEKQRADRRVDVCPGPTGMAEIYALVPSDQAAAMWDATCELARDYQQDDPTLSTDQARTDAFVDLVLANVEVTARVDLGVPVLTSETSRLGDAESDESCEELDEGAGSRSAAEVVGREALTLEDAEEWDRRRDVDTEEWFARYRSEPTPQTEPTTEARPEGPAAAPQEISGALVQSVASGGRCLSGVHLPKVGFVPPDVVAGIVSHVGTQIGMVLLDAKTGTLMGTTRTAYRPDAQMRHFITMRDQRCRMFGCQQSAAHWDIDHAVAHPRGPTSPVNLAGLCRRHHRAKQRRSWRYHLRADGVATWQSPSGAIRVTYPEHVVPPSPHGRCHEPTSVQEPQSVPVLAPRREPQCGPGADDPPPF